MDGVDQCRFEAMSLMHESVHCGASRHHLHCIVPHALGHPRSGGIAAHKLNKNVDLQRIYNKACRETDHLHIDNTTFVTHLFNLRDAAIDEHKTHLDL